MSSDGFSSEEEFFDATEEPVQHRRRDGRVQEPPALRQPELDLLDLDTLLDAIAAWPSPTALQDAWSPSVPSLSLPDDAHSAQGRVEEDDFDPERTPRPPQRDSMRRSMLSEASRTPPSLHLADFPAPPPRATPAGVSPSRRRRESFFVGPGDEEEEEDDWHSDALSSPAYSSPTHSRHGSYERNAFRWSSSTTSTVLTMASRSYTSDSVCDTVEEEEDPQFSTTAPLHIRRASDTARKSYSAEPSYAPMTAPRMIRSHTDPPKSATRRSKEPEWNTLIDELFGIEPRAAPRPPVWQERDLPAIPTPQEKRRMHKKASSASIKSAMSINGAFPFLNARKSSLKRSALNQAQTLQSRFD